MENKRLVVLQGKSFVVELNSYLGSSNYGWCISKLPEGILALGMQNEPVYVGEGRRTVQKFYFGAESAPEGKESCSIQFKIACLSNVTEVTDQYEVEVVVIPSNSEEFVSYQANENDAAIPYGYVYGGDDAVMKYGYPCGDLPVEMYGVPCGEPNVNYKYGYPCGMQDAQGTVVKYGYPCGMQDAQGAVVKYGYPCGVQDVQNANYKYGYPCGMQDAQGTVVKYGYPCGMQDAQGTVVKYGYPCGMQDAQGAVVKYGYPCGVQDVQNANYKYGYPCGVQDARQLYGFYCLGNEARDYGFPYQR